MKAEKNSPNDLCKKYNGARLDEYHNERQEAVRASEGRILHNFLMGFHDLKDKQSSDESVYTGWDAERSQTQGIEPKGYSRSATTGENY